MTAIQARPRLSAETTREAAWPAEAMIFDGDAASLGAYRAAISRAVDLLAGDSAERTGPYGGTGLVDLKRMIAAIDPCPETGEGLGGAIDGIGRMAVRHALSVSHPATVAHLHCPVALPALVAELILSATNQSMDSWDQSPFASLAEDHVVAWLCRLCGLPQAASGSFTSGGSQSNLTGLHLAREAAIAKSGLGTAPAILCSQEAHFTIAKSARILGLGDDAVVTVETCADGRMRIDALVRAVADLKAKGRGIVALVATAGTTDLGSIDPLPEMAGIAEANGLWLHVDAAYGAGLLFSDRHRPQLAGLERADSVVLDFHKMLFQPISCGALLLRDAAGFAPLATKADYLNPEEEVFPGAPNLVERSVQTSRRFDALKVLMTCRALGRKAIGDMIDATLANAVAAAASIRELPGFELAHRPALSTVVFRYVASGDADRSDAINMAIRRDLFLDGTVALATTRRHGRVHLKLTLLNPASGGRTLERILSILSRKAHELEQSHAV